MVLGGVFTPADPPEEPRGRRYKKMNVNDGRAPDSVEAIAAFQNTAQVELKKTTKGKQRRSSKSQDRVSAASQPVVHSSISERPSSASSAAHSSPHARLLFSYPWKSPNSCFIDAALELYFRSFLQMPLAEWNALLASVSADTTCPANAPTPAAKILSHFAQRRNWAAIQNRRGRDELDRRGEEYYGHGPEDSLRLARRYLGFWNE